MLHHLRLELGSRAVGRQKSRRIIYAMLALSFDVDAGRTKQHVLGDGGPRALDISVARQNAAFDRLEQRCDLMLRRIFAMKHEVEDIGSERGIDVDRCTPAGERYIRGVMMRRCNLEKRGGRTSTDDE